MPDPVKEKGYMKPSSKKFIQLVSTILAVIPTQVLRIVMDLLYMNLHLFYGFIISK